MLSPDLVRARRRGDQLKVTPLKGKDLESALLLAGQILELFSESVGCTQDELSEALMSIEREARHEKLFSGLLKMVQDQSEFGSSESLEPPELRLALFERAALARRQVESAEGFVRAEIIKAEADSRELQAPVLEAALYSDLKGAARLGRAPSCSKEDLLIRYEQARVQGVFLRAVSLSAEVYCSSPDDYRALFQKLKFRRLLHRIEKVSLKRGAGYRIDIDGPFSLFESVTKYGMQLAQIVPALLACDEVAIQGELRWGKERLPLQFDYQSSGQGEAELPPLRDDVKSIWSALTKACGPDEDVDLAEEILDLPGVGLCVPDLCYDAGNGPIYLEVLGYWSRPAVWQRIEWAQAAVERGKERPILFVVPAKLRVSEALLDDIDSAALYVFKGRVSGQALLKKLKGLS